MSKKVIIYIGNFLFPEGDAASKLVESNGRILNDLGYKVIYISKDFELGSNSTILETKNYYDFSEYFRIPFHKSIRQLLGSSKRYNEVIELFELYKNQLECIILYGAPSTNFFLVSKISKWCLRNNIRFIGNIADISAFSHGTIFERILKWGNYSILRYYLKYTTDGIIAVSKYIKDYFSYKENKIIIIPPLTNSEEVLEPYIINNSKTNLVYAGIPFPIDGRRVDVSSYKDRLDIIIELLSKVYKINQKFKFDIYGLTKEEYLMVIKEDKTILDEMSEFIEFHGKVNHRKVVKAISEADFTI